MCSPTNPAASGMPHSPLLAVVISGFASEQISVQASGTLGYYQAPKRCSSGGPKLSNTRQKVRWNFVRLCPNLTEEVAPPTVFNDALSRGVLALFNRSVVLPAEDDSTVFSLSFFP